MVLIITNVTGLENKSIVFYEINKYTIHAEQDCIMKFKKKFGNNNKILKRSTLIIVKLNRSSKIVECMPCKMCKKIIQKYQIQKVISLRAQNFS